MGVGSQRSGQSASASAGAVAPDPLGLIAIQLALGVVPSSRVYGTLGILFVHRYGETR